MKETIPQLIVQFRSWILITVTASGLLAFTVSLFLPKEYLSEASVLPANSKMMDKQAMFGSNIQELYSAYGEAEDLDRLMATLHSPTVLQFVSDSLDLSSHYNVKGEDAGRRAMVRLTKHVTLNRSEYGEIKIKVWDKDPGKAQDIAALILSRTQQVYDEMFAGYYDRSINRLEKEYQVILTDTSQGATSTNSSDLELVRNRIAEYRMARLNPPAAIFILARPEKTVLPDKPDVAFNTVFAALVGLFTVMAWITATHIWKSGYAKP
jgi:capsular polysaccharide biosynthesis protein